MKKTAKGFAKKPTPKKPTPKKPAPKKASAADFMSGFESQMRQMLEFMKLTNREPTPQEPQLPIGRPPMNLDPELPMLAGAMPLEGASQNSDWTRETMMAKIGTLEARMDVAMQAINAMRTEIASFYSRRK